VKAWEELLAKGKTTALWRRQVEYCLQAARARIEAEGSGSEGQARDMTCSEGGRPVKKRQTAPQIAGAGKKGPTAEQVAAASKMTAGDRSEMINQMVSGLAERLKEDGNDLEGWVKLVRAYTVLGKRDEALKAFADAEKNFKGNSEALGTLQALRKQLKL
ncbi:MAG: tetratricopeptide repeat protein, partial [Methyloligellaceae bacterium]